MLFTMSKLILFNNYINVKYCNFVLSGVLNVSNVSWSDTPPPPSAPFNAITWVIEARNKLAWCSYDPYCTIYMHEDILTGGLSVIVHRYYLLFPEQRQVRVCNGENISISCTEGNLIHVDRFMFGDLDSLSKIRTCPSLLASYYGTYGQYHCEVSVLTYNVSYHNEVIAACEGKTRCDGGLRALAGSALGWCGHDPDSIRTLYYDTPTDYVAVEYYCHPGLFCIIIMFAIVLK